MSKEKTNLLREVRELKDRWGRPFVTRADLIEFSCGLIRNTKTIRNADSRGNGIKDGFRIGRTVAYPVDSVINYLASKFEAKISREQIDG